MRFPFFNKPTAEPTELSKADSRLLTTLRLLEEKRLSLVQLKGFETIELALRRCPDRRIAELVARMSINELNEIRMKFRDEKPTLKHFLNRHSAAISETEKQGGAV
jgi:hypothetical protein